MHAEIEPAVGVRQRRPGRAHLDLARLGRVFELPEPAGDGTGHRAPCGGVTGSSALQRLGQPAPAHPRQRRVGGHLGLDVGRDEGDDPGVAAPAVLTGRIVQDDEPTACHLLVVAADLGRDREGMRCEALGGRHLLQVQARPVGMGDRVAQAEKGGAEQLRHARWLQRQRHGRNVRRGGRILGQPAP